MFRLTAKRPDHWTRGDASTDHQSSTDPGVSHSRPNGASVNVPASRTARRRWNRKPRFTLSGAAAWALVTLVVGTILIAACVLLTLGAPS